MSSETSSFKNVIAQIRQLYDPIQTTAIAPDQPIRRKYDDQFNRGLFAARVGRTIALRRDSSSVAIGIYAPWGEGKTSVLHLIEESLLQYNHIVPVWFNPWIFGTPQEVTQGFFATVAAALDKDIRTRVEKVGEKLKQYGKWVSAVGNLAGKSLDGVDGLGESLSDVSIEEERVRVSKILRETGKRVVVFMDDIDRLDKDEIQTVFKLIKLTADLEQIVYVLAFDDELVANALQEGYGVNDPLAGRRFLEKIVQVPLRLPAAPKKTLRLYALKAIEQALKDAQILLSQQQAGDYIHSFDEGLSSRITTPRLAKLHANAITFALPILEGEVDPVEAMLVEGLRILYPALYDLIRKEPQLFLDPVNEFGSSYRPGITAAEKDAIKMRLDNVLEVYSAAEQNAAKELLFRLFPRFKGVYRNEGHDVSMDAVWARGKRVAATQYFDRYFTYAIPLGDIADRDISSLLAFAGSATVDQVVENIKQLVDLANASNFIGKLRQNEESCPLPAGIVLAQALARTANEFPTSDGWAIFTTRTQVAVFISEIIARIEDGERAIIAKRIVNDASTAEFARDLIHWLGRSPKNQRHEELQVPILTADAIGELITCVVGRIEREARQTDFLEVYQNNEARSVLYMWAEHSGRAATQTYLYRIIAGQPDKLIKFLSWYVPTGIDLSDGRPILGSFRRESYNSVSALIDPEVIAKELKTAGLGQVKTTHNLASFDENLAKDFLSLHTAITNPPSDAPA